MTFPLLSSTYADGELVTSANLYSRVLAVVNTLGGFLYGEDEGAPTDSVTLTATGTNFILPAVQVTFTLSQQRRVRIAYAARMVSGTAIGNMDIYPAYVAGATATLIGATLLGIANTNRVTTTATGSNGATTGSGEHSVVLAAGQWTAFVVANRFSAGSATDTANSGYCAVYDAGNV